MKPTYEELLHLIVNRPPRRSIADHRYEEFDRKAAELIERVEAADGERV